MVRAREQLTCGLIGEELVAGRGRKLGGRRRFILDLRLSGSIVCQKPVPDRTNMAKVASLGRDGGHEESDKKT